MNKANANKKNRIFTAAIRSFLFSGLAKVKYVHIARVVVPRCPINRHEVRIYGSDIIT